MSCFDNIAADLDKYRFLNKENTIFARDMYSTYWKDYINMFGVRTGYYIHGYDVNNHDFIYGEDPTAPFSDQKSINMILEFQSDALVFAKFGFETNADIIGAVSIAEYRNKFGMNSEPKAGDIIELTESAWLTSELPMYTDSTTHGTTGFDAKTLLCEYKDPEHVASIILSAEDLYGYRFVRYPQLFEITEVKYQDYTMGNINFLQGHYVWKIHAKRFDYSFEPNISGENPNQQVYDNDFFGNLSGSQVQKPYPQEVDAAGDKTWDYNNKGTDTSPYGYY